MVSREHRDSLERIFACPVHFDADKRFSFKQGAAAAPHRPHHRSLNDFLRNSVYHLLPCPWTRLPIYHRRYQSRWAGIDLPSWHAKSFAAVASHAVHVESSLRRRLRGKTPVTRRSKDEVRCEFSR